MDELRKSAYRAVLAAGLVHIKWDLACWNGGARLLYLSGHIDAARRAAYRSRMLHNLAIFSAYDFEGFREELFWRDVDQFQKQWPSATCPYHNIFERTLRGEPVHVLAPDGAGDPIDQGR
jgi:hypothetical protein